MKFRKHNNKICLEENKKVLAFIEYTEEKDKLIINHTFVNEALRGQGIAKKLVDKVKEEADKQGKKTEAICSYAKKILK